MPSAIATAVAWNTKSRINRFAICEHAIIAETHYGGDMQTLFGGQTLDMVGIAVNRTCVSANGSIGASSGELIAAGTYANWLTIQNTHATQNLFITFGATATSADFKLPAGAALTLPFGVANALNGIGSGAGTTYSVIGA